MTFTWISIKGRFDTAAINHFSWPRMRRTRTTLCNYSLLSVAGAQRVLISQDRGFTDKIVLHDGLHSSAKSCREQLAPGHGPCPLRLYVGEDGQE